jgi:hypothetical protein
MIPAALSRSREAATAAEGQSDYFATESHYLSLANRIAGALRGGGIVLVTGDPPPVPHLLSQALRKTTRSRPAVVDIACRADLTSEELSRACSVVAALPTGGMPAGSEIVEAALPIFVFADTDQLSNQRIGEICETVEHGSHRDAAALLLARPSFLARIEEDSLRFLKQRLVARFEFQDIGSDEGIEFLRHQLASRHARNEARGITPGVLRGLAASGVLLTLGIGAFLFLERYYPVGEPSARSDAQESVAPRLMPSEKPVEAPAPIAPDLPPTTLASQPAPLPQESLSRNAVAPTGAQATLPAPEPPSMPPTSADQHPPSAEIAALVSRGDGFLSAGDITSARLFYERAADAGNASAALRLGTTFDPGFPSRAGIRGIPGDATQAASWYRRARDLGDPAAAERLENLDQQRAGEPRPSTR